MPTNRKTCPSGGLKVEVRIGHVKNRDAERDNLLTHVVDIVGFQFQEDRLRDGRPGRSGELSGGDFQTQGDEGRPGSPVQGRPGPGTAGTSVRTLVEIESGRANASPATLGAIADALGADFGRLTQADEPGAMRTLHTTDAAVAWSDDRGSVARLVLVSREPQSVELWHWLLKPDSRYQAEPDPEGTDVLVMVTRGTLAMTVNGEASQLKQGTAVHLTSGAGYQLANAGRADTAFLLVHIPPAVTRARYARTDARPRASNGETAARSEGTGQPR